MALYRGPGGASDATNDATSQSILAASSAAQAATSAAAASASASQAATSATNSASSATSSANSATAAASSANSASTSATNAANSATAAQTAQTAAELAETNAETAEANAETAEANATASASLAQDWATKTSGPVAGGEYSSKYNAQLAATSATNAANSATSASTSASAASTSATNAASSATAAASSASTASTYATNAANSATSAAGSATSAASSASTATTQASNAASSATTAATSASNAAISETNAANSASAAATSETNAANSASSANTSATNASNSASAAATSATNAANSATSAATSATNAANSATLAASFTPSQTGNSGKYLTTNGTSASWGSLASVATSGSYTDLSNKPTIPTNLNSLTDVVITSPATNQVVQYNGTNWVNSTLSVTVSDGDKGDITVASSGTSWTIDSGTVTPAKLSTGSPSWDTSGNFLMNSGYGSAATAYGCRAWVNFNGIGTVAIRASGNVSSITDNGVGDYTVNFSNAMPDANYSAVGTNSSASNTSGTVCIIDPSSYATGSCRVWSVVPGTYGSSSMNKADDATYFTVSVFR